MLGESTLFLTGAEGAQLFYDETRFRRAGAAPKLVLNVSRRVLPTAAVDPTSVRGANGLAARVS